MLDSLQQASIAFKKDVKRNYERFINVNNEEATKLANVVNQELEKGFTFIHIRKLYSISERKLRKLQNLGLVPKRIGGRRPRIASSHWLSKWRIEVNISQLELAMLIGVDQATISHWENGRTMPKLAINLIKLIDEIGINECNSIMNGS